MKLQNRLPAQIFIYIFSFENKLDEIIPNNQFSISGYRMFRQDRNCFGGELYTKENSASKQLNVHSDKETETIYLEINIQLWKWFILGLYKSPSQNSFLFSENMLKNLSRYPDSYESITLLGDFDMTAEDKNL